MTERQDKIAFPCVIDDASKNQFFDIGMTLRDYFAAQIITGMASNDYWAQNINGDSTSMVGAARVAYQMADTMMEVREP
jgi:hypothetical protein